MKNRKPYTMKALDALHTRISVPRLGEPLPDEEIIKNIYRAAFRAADHGLLPVWLDRERPVRDVLRQHIRVESTPEVRDDRAGDARGEEGVGGGEAEEPRN